MVIDELLETLPPPSRPVDPGSDAGWLRVTRRLGTRLPVDFVHFVRHYGTGDINGYLSVLNPFARGRNVNLLAAIPGVLSNLRALRRMEPSAFPYPLYFEPNGLLPWGLTEDGEYLCWQTTAMEDLWPVVFISPSDGESERFEMCMARVLAGLLRRELASTILPADVFRDPPSFTPTPKAA